MAHSMAAIIEWPGETIHIVTIYILFRVRREFIQILINRIRFWNSFFWQCWLMQAGCCWINLFFWLFGWSKSSVNSSQLLCLFHPKPIPILWPYKSHRRKPPLDACRTCWTALQVSDKTSKLRRSGRVGGLVFNKLPPVAWVYWPYWIREHVPGVQFHLLELEFEIFQEELKKFLVKVIFSIHSESIFVARSKIS